MYGGSFSFEFSADLSAGRRSGFRYRAWASDDAVYRSLCGSLEGIGGRDYFYHPTQS